MLLPENIHPLASLYYIGSHIIQALRGIHRPDMLELFAETRLYYNVSMPIFVLSLDWLFLADLVKLDDDGKIVPCF
ncbi:ABC-three component system middle component 6 [Janthinobacterium sp. HLX7-2]|uniref:ABC-three component system middle component 6 n=1 Tax=Janthinobacterium sp. HLX7-2 TaxID=1259331 RepID=UPI003F250C45